MKVDELIRQLENIKIDEVDKRKKDVIRYIFDTLTKTTNEFNSIIYINNGVVKYFSPEEGDGGHNIIINSNKAYDWFRYEVTNNDTIIVYVSREYTVSRYVSHLLYILPETPISDNVYSVFKKLYNYLRQGYKITFYSYRQ